MANQELLKDVMCPQCFETERFAVQVTMNVLVVDSGFDHFASQPRLDHFPGRVLDENDGFDDTDPISCANRNGCGYTATFAEFRAHTKELAHV